MVAAQTSAAEMLLSPEIKPEMVVRRDPSVEDADCICVEREEEAEERFVSTPATAVRIEDVACPTRVSVFAFTFVWMSEASVPNEVSVLDPLFHTELAILEVE